MRSIFKFIKFHSLFVLKLKASITSQLIFAKELEKIGDLDGVIRETFYSYKPFIKRNPDAWVE